MRTQKELVLRQMETYYTITQKEALRLYGIARLASRIHELRQDGIKIFTRSVCVKTRRGEAYITEYSLRKFT